MSRSCPHMIDQVSGNAARRHSMNDARHSAILLSPGMKMWKMNSVRKVPTSSSTPRGQSTPRKPSLRMLSAGPSSQPIYLNDVTIFSAIYTHVGPKSVSPYETSSSCSISESGLLPTLSIVSLIFCIYFPTFSLSKTAKVLLRARSALHMQTHNARRSVPTRCRPFLCVP